MGGVDVGGGGKGGRKSLDSEINMIPMIDLLMVTISFLLITAVWTQMARINADAKVKSNKQEPTEEKEDDKPKDLHVTLQEGDPMSATRKFTVAWMQGTTAVITDTVESTAPASKDGVTRSYPELAKKIDESWKNNGAHRDASDKKVDQVVLHVTNTTPYGEFIGILDAVSTPQRDYKFGDKVSKGPALNATFAAN